MPAHYILQDTYFFYNEVYYRSSPGKMEAYANDRWWPYKFSSLHYMFHAKFLKEKEIDPAILNAPLVEKDVYEEFLEMTKVIPGPSGIRYFVNYGSIYRLSENDKNEILSKSDFCWHTSKLTKEDLIKYGEEITEEELSEKFIKAHTTDEPE